MSESCRPEIEITPADEEALIAGARDTTPVRGLTHAFYKYPARFSPAFARAAINAFTQPGDLVLDNHVGGGTTLVEALMSGRNAVGVDISPLAEFVATVKTTIYTEAELDTLQEWSKTLPYAIHVRKSSIYFPGYDELGYYKHLDGRSRWRLRKAVEQGIGAALRLPSPGLEAFGRCVVLRVAQWALDGRAKLPSLSEFRDFLSMTAEGMVNGARALHAAAPSPLPTIAVIKRPAVGLENDSRLRGPGGPRLVLTSPPYPGVHVLYHRWQVDGRKESPLPFMIANKLDGCGGSHYTMGDRKYPELATYFANIRAAMSSVAALADHSTIVVQMLAFSEPSWQLPRYIAAMDAAGLTEVFLPTLKNEADGRLWRNVPGRRWYSDQRGETPGSREVVLIHRRKAAR
jgi:DNA methylase